MENKAVVFDIKEFAIYDGRGVRQTVFFKGCPLRCAWCHNPEGLSKKVELAVSASSCTDCGKCRSVCPSPNTWNKHFAKSEECISCFKCTAICPMGLRRQMGREYSVDELSQKILSKAEYYKRCNGGVTFSGGEPLLWYEFLCQLLDKLGDVHKAMESSGYAKKEAFESVISRLDYVIMDIKCMDDSLHTKYTGVSNSRILENYKILRESRLPHTIRIPLISGVSDSPENMARTAKLLSGDQGLERVELLPYQKSAGAKYRMVGREYNPEFNRDGELFCSAEIFERHNVRCKVL